MKLDWSLRKIEEWRTHFAKVPRANHLQSMPFARALALTERKSSRFALIFDNENPIGMVAVHEFKVGPLHLVSLFRGPLWFCENPPDAWLAEFATLLNAEYPRRILRFRKWLPEWNNSDVAKRVLHAMGFKRKRETYETIWLDLRQSDAELRSHMKPNWRNHLNKGERSNIRVSSDWTGKTGNLFLHKYELDRKTRKYPGRSIKFLREEICAALCFNEMFIMWAVKDEKTVAAILVFIHGKSASYRIGWTTPAGRECNAHNVLLWEAVKILKDKGLTFFDLCGVEPATAEGVTAFKRGMGGEDYVSVGMFG